MKERNTKARG